ncbi:MAG TPA: PQQ-binding-like beta-propeller repeat protein [Vicinamibacteria bacterium]|nr:PQQ-binding-like beta-propeller repeat protein [Vicinamibacteria bacterium]
MRKALAGIGFSCLLVAAVASGQDWPQWRGPARDGQAVGIGAPKSWPKELKRAWNVPVGIGHASPVVAGARVFVFSRVGDKEALSALDLATGKLAWSQSYPAPYSMNSAATSHGMGPKSTPLVSGGRVFTFGISGVLSCFAADTGRVVWRKDFTGAFKTTSPLYGAATSPILEGGLLVVHVGGHDDGALTAFDPATGAVRWALEGDGPGYASPVAADLAGARQLVTETQTRVIGVDPTKGALLWSVPFTTAWDQNAVTPLVLGDTVVFSGENSPVRALRPTRAGAAMEAKVAWDSPEAAFYLSSPVAAGGRLIGFSHKKKGHFVALDAKTGRLAWTSEGRQGDNAALVALGTVVLALTAEGKLVVFDGAAGAYAPLATYDVADSATWAHPAPVRGGFLVKDVDSLALWKLE